MKILTIIQQYPPQRYIGAELYDHALHKYLKKQGHTVHVKIEDSGKRWEYEGIPVNPPVTYTDYDIILTHVDYYQEAKHYQKHYNLKNTPIVVIQHNFSEWTIKDEAFYNFAGVIYNSKHMLNSSKNKTVNKTVLTPPCKKPSTITTSSENIMIIGTTRPKGVGIFNSLAQKLPDKTFIGIEGGWGQNLKLDYPNITFVDQTRNLTPYFRTASHLLVPSHFESWSMAAGEAIGYGVTVVSYDDLPGVIENIGPAGYYLNRNRNIWGWVETLKNTIDPVIVKQQALKNFNNHQQGLKDTVKMLQEIAHTT